ncbi:MAG TPA: FtsX-like permease family protein [Ilumatobacteraceae bacterium]|nr:FtsX-like permease family protein [Ilumatobacteraceae bacterium]
MFHLTLRELAAKKLRLLTTAIAVMLGVAFMAGTLVLTSTISKTFDGLFTDGYAGTDAYVRATSQLDAEFGAQRPRLDASIVDSISQVDGVAAAEGKVSGYAQLVDAAGKPVGDPGQGAPTFGETWMTVADLNPYRIAEGHAPTGPDEIVIDRHSATTGHVRVGDVTTVLTKQGAQPFTVAGIATFGDADSMGGASAVLFDAPTAEALVAEPGKVDAVAVVAAPGVSEQQVSDSIAKVIPTGTEVLTGAQITAETQSDVKDELSFFNTFLMAFAIIALFVGAFIIFNTFSIIVAQRQKEMALLRALGASNRQVTRSVLIEATAVGLISSIAGVAAGVGVAKLLKSLLDAFGFDIPAGPVVVQAGMIITCLVVGTIITVASALIPARRAGRIPPIAAMREVAVDHAGTSRKRMIVGSGILVAGIASLIAGLNGGTIQLVGLGAAVMFIAVAVLAPVLARPTARLIGWPMAKFGGVSGNLGRENAMRTPKRTASTAAALMIGVALVGFIMTFAASAKASINGAVDRDFHGDYVLDTGTFGIGGVSHNLAADLATRPEFSAVTSTRFAAASIDGSVTELNSFDSATLTSIFDIQPQQGDITTLGADGIAVEDSTAEEHGWTLGSSIPVTFAEGSTNLTVKAIYGDDTWAGSAFVDHAVFNSFGIDPLDAKIYVRDADTTDAATARATLEEAATTYPSVEVMDHAEFKASKAGDIDTLLNLIYALLGLAIVIALIGITNTLALSIFERTRELGLLRAIGMTRSQLRATVRWESMIIALFGTALGLSIGLFFGWSMVHALADKGFGVFVVPATSLAVVAVIAAIAGVVAALLPARRAARLDVLGAIATQ